METRKEQAEKTVARKKQDRYDVKTKCSTVLAIWSERRKPADLCRELGIHWGLLTRWQNQAMEGMLQALSPKGQGQERHAALNPLLERRLARKLALRSAKANRLQQRLKAVESGGSLPEKPKE